MYFGELTKSVQKFNESTTFVDFNVPSEAHLKALVQAKYAENTSDKPTPIFLEYVRLQYISNLSYVNSELKISSDEHLTMHLFEKLLFDNDTLNDHLYGTFNRIDLRTRSPLIAVINERYILQKTNRDRNSFKMFWHIPAE